MPYLLIRYEDALLHPEAVVAQVSQCLGMSTTKDFVYQHGKSNLPGTDLLAALEHYTEGRYTGMVHEDRLYLQQSLDRDLLEALHYTTLPRFDYVDATNEQFAGFERSFSHCWDKKRLLGILHRAGKENITDADCLKLPSWQTVATLYGEEPVILGLDRCDKYKTFLAAKAVHGNDVESEPLVGGLFNTGTTAFSEALSLNFRMVNDSRNAYALPGGKHTLLSSRHWYKQLSNTSDLPFLPIILIRDPLRWMGSMCKASYKAVWTKGYQDRCPNLVPSVLERTMPQFRNMSTFEVIVEQNQPERYASLADMWLKWYRLFLEAEFPRLIVRFEDTIFHAEKVMDQVTKCFNRPMQRPYQYLLERSKNRSSEFSEVLGRYGSEAGRYDHLTHEDALYFTSIILPSMMEMFHYPRVPLKALQSGRIAASSALAVLDES